VSDFKKGDRVRVTYEGVVSWTSSLTSGLEVEADDGVVYYANRGVALVERPVEKPALKAGDVVTRPGTGGVYLIGNMKVAFSCPGGEVIELKRTPTEVAEMVARNPGKYKINGEVFA
jgi:hypothetical protein